MMRFLSRPFLGGLLVLVLAGCDDGAPRISGEPYIPPAGGAPVTEKIQTEQWRAWPLEHRAAYIAGRVTAADMLYRMGYREAAAQHLKQPVTQINAVDPAGLQAIGFRFEVISAAAGAIDAGQPAETVEPLLAEAGTNLMDVLTASEAAPGELVRFLMRLCAEAYDRGVDQVDVVDEEAYQAAFGYAVTARDLVSPLDIETYGDLRLELDILVLMWPAGGPVEGAAPPPEIRMAEQLQRVKLALIAVP